MAHGGRRKGAGRKPGATTRRTKEIADKAIAEGLTPLEYLLSLMRDESLSSDERKDAAKAAAPYVHPRLNAVDHTSTDGSMAEKPTVIQLVAPKIADEG